MSEPGEPADLRRQNYQDSVAWYAAITADMFAKAGVWRPEKVDAALPPAASPGEPDRR